MTRPVNILALMKLCGSAFGGDSWAAWRVVLRAAFALPLRGKDLEIYRALTGRWLRRRLRRGSCGPSPGDVPARA